MGIIVPTSQGWDCDSVQVFPFGPKSNSLSEDGKWLHPTTHLPKACFPLTFYNPLPTHVGITVICCLDGCSSFSIGHPVSMSLLQRPFLCFLHKVARVTVFVVVDLFCNDLLRYKSHTIKFTHLKHIIQWVSVYAQICATITTTQF